MKLNRFNLVLAVFCAIAFLVVGCNQKSASRAGLVKAEGVLTYNGQPVSDATIEMNPVVEGAESCVAVARTDEKGKFVMMTDRPDDGALPGKYKTVVKKQVETIDGMSREEYEKAHNPEGRDDFYIDKNKLKKENLLPAKYADPLTTPLEIEIPEKGNKKIEITLED